VNRNALIGLAVATLLVACGGGGGGSGSGSTASDSTANAGASGSNASNPGSTTPNSSPPASTNTGSTTDTTPPVDPNPPAVDIPPPPTAPSLPTSTQSTPSTPPTSQQLPTGVDTSNPGVAVKPQSVTASSQLGGNTAANAVDGNATTRWESNHDDAEWIQFDFGAKTQIGSIKMTWEGAYAKEYSILVSDDGSTWYQSRYRADGTGGTEQWMNLNANVRYIRINCITRATQYGNSLYEVSFESPGSDNTLGTTVTASAVAFPTDGGKLAPPPAQTPPLEGIRFTLADGTLVTRLGVVGRGRHARERGEDWNEIGFGPNDTVDAAGNPQDKGPGDYLPFVKNYFKKRAWGVEIIDNSNVAGVTKPTLRVNQYFQEIQKAGGTSFFRGFDRPGVTGYGWMNPGQLVNPQLYTNDLTPNSTSCPVVPLPPEGTLSTASGLNNGCSITMDNYPGHSALSPNADGVLVPNGTSIPSRALVPGDVIEFTTAFFSSPDGMAAVGDPGGAFRYYTTEVTYVMGVGLRPWYGVQPRLNNAPLPDDALQGGIGSTPYDYADNSTFMFQQAHNNVGMQDMQRFLDGRRLFHTDMTTGVHTEPGNDVDTDAIGLQGPLFNQHTCFGCHINNGRSLAPVVPNQRLDTMAVLTAELDSNGVQVPHKMYGLAAQMDSQPSTNGVRTDWGTSVYVSGFTTKSVALADGTAVQLSKPKIAFTGPTPALYSLRSAQPVIGLGLIEAIPEAAILANARTAPDADGVKGVANYAFDPETGAVRVGRFGWKAAKVSLRHQIAAAALQDLSVTTPIFPSRNCLYGPAQCTTGTAQPGLSADFLQRLTRYVSLLAVPAQRSLASGFPKGVTPLAPLDVNPTLVTAGETVFKNIKCSTCHVQSWTTGTTVEMDENRNQKIKPYSDFLLHDMGPDMADNFAEGQATGSMWRTQPLWGVGYTEKVAGTGIQVGYLHDGRARNLTEAIMWHLGGEGNASAQRFQALSAADRAALLAFLGSL
jgi:CxxC motif-containing protein (DUF1111 family)